MDKQLGLRENWRQFTLLVIINGFVGGMVGLERTILPQIAEVDFGLAAKTAVLSFIVVFGISKAITNYYTGVWASRWGRKKLLVWGWLIGMPVPVLLIFANSWELVVFANVLLGINQGMTWSSTVVMKIDLVGEKNRGFAMGLNESAGYLAVGLVAFLTGWIAAEYGLRPYPFYLGIGFAAIGLLSSQFLVKDTVHYVASEAKSSAIPKLKHVFRETSWLNPNLGAISQAGLVNNLNDGMIWGLLPILLLEYEFDLTASGKLVAIYPVVWGLGQIATGKLADHFDKKRMLFLGMLLQGVTILFYAYTDSFIWLAILGVILGIGTAIVYPTFLAAMADNTHPEQRAQSIGVFRLWRDLGYAVGAVVSGVIADLFGIQHAILSIGTLTVLSAMIIQLRMRSSIH
ncbi:MAG: MFS transporter [Cyclobacteriaceae bacterium]